MTIFHCMPIKENDIRRTDECYLDIPIRFLIDDKYYDGYLSLTELEIVTKSYAKDCKHFNPQYYGNDPVYVWNGKHFNVTKIDDSIHLEQILNSLHDNLKFTSECEKDGNFHFLDVNIKFMDGQFYTSTFVKPTNTGLYLLLVKFF